MTPVLIDTDPGIDDALALLFAWNSPEILVEAITTVAGNVSLDAASTNLLRLLALRRPVPRPVVAAGAAGPLARALTTATRYHGEDGLGDLPDWPPVERAKVADVVGCIGDRAGHQQRPRRPAAPRPLARGNDRRRQPRDRDGAEDHHRLPLGRQPVTAQKQRPRPPPRRRHRNERRPRQLPVHARTLHRA